MPIFGVGLRFQEIFGVDLAFGSVVRRPAHGPRKLLGIVEHGGAGADEEMRHLLLVDVFDDRIVGRGADGIDEEQDLLALDQLPDLLHGFRRAVGIVERDVIDLAPIHPAFIVDFLEPGGGRHRARRIGRCRAAERRGGADLDFRVGDAGAVFLLRQRRRCGETERKQRQCAARAKIPPGHISSRCKRRGRHRLFLC